MLVTLAKYSILLPLALAVYTVLSKRGRSSILNIIIGLVVFFAFSEAIFSLTSGSNNLFLLVPYLAGEFVLVALVFTGLTPHWKRNLMVYGALILAVILLENAFGKAWLPFSRTLEGLVLSMAAVQWFRSSYSLEERKIERLPGFWFSCAILIYFVPTLPIFLSSAELFTLSPYWTRTLFNIKNGLNIASKLSLTIAIVKWR